MTSRASAVSQGPGAAKAGEARAASSTAVLTIGINREDIALGYLRCLGKGVRDDKRSKTAPVLKVFAVERVAAGLDGRRNDERVIEVETMIPGERDGSPVRLCREG